MNQFKKFEPWANLVYFVMLTIAGACGINAMRGWHALGDLLSDSSGGGIYTFLLVLYWILIIPAAIFKIYNTLVETGVMGKMGSAASSAQHQNNFSQPQQQNFAQPVNNSIPQPSNIPTPAPQAVPQPTNAAGKVCPNCGASVPADSQFCVNCGTKV